MGASVEHSAGMFKAFFYHVLGEDAFRYLGVSGVWTINRPMGAEFAL